MGKSQLSLSELREMIIFVANRMIESKDRLTQADKAIGDGDHGIGMARGFESVLNKVGGQEFATLETLFKTVGTTLLTSIGGAAGAVFGTFFRGGAESLKNQDVLTAEAFSRILQDGLKAVKDRGQAKPGDKTMVDALEPAAAEARNREADRLDEALAAIAESARLGMEKTKEMVAAVGKAKTLGERSLGHPDPGAVSIYLILDSMKEYVEGR
jgi:dihydroxyacetone kinase-like protein